jgi:hypothetical protein
MYTISVSSFADSDSVAFSGIEHQRFVSSPCFDLTQKICHSELIRYVRCLQTVFHVPVPGDALIVAIRGKLDTNFLRPPYC